MSHHLKSNALKCRDMMLAITIGDAFGAGYENLNREEIKNTLNMEEYQKYPNRKSAHIAGHYTDDTQMSIAVAELLFSSANFNFENLAAYIYKSFQRDRRVGYSKASKDAMESHSIDEYLSRVNKQSNRNGAITRSVPIGVLKNPDKVIDYAVINSKFDHDTPSSIASAVCIALASHYFYHTSGEPEQFLDYYEEKISDFDKETADYLRNVAEMETLDEDLLFGEECKFFGVPVNAKKTSGAVLYIISKFHDDPLEILKEAVLLGGDTDTVASTCLGITATRTGLDRLPEFFMRDLEDGQYGVKYIENVGKKLATILPITVSTVKRFNYLGSRQNMVVHGLDGIAEPTDAVYVEELMRKLMSNINYRRGDILVALDSSGYIPGLAASKVTGLPLICAKKADLDISNKIESIEPGTPHEQIFLYNLPDKSNVIIVDDEIMTGKTVLNLIDALTKKGHKVIGVVVPLESSRYNAREELKEKGYELVSFNP
jgi:ADP-ribosylglycohydrolase/adenine/guanine phosphoribosyltransferase-like PRPP-binding protein